jgi:hypothetical protein
MKGAVLLAFKVALSLYTYSLWQSLKLRLNFLHLLS